MDDVSTLDTNEFMRTVDNTQHQGFAQGQLGGHQRRSVSATYLSDPTDVSGRRQRDITNARDRAREQGGARYSGNYTRVWGGDASRNRRQQAQRRSHRPLGDPRIAQRRAVPDRRRARADRRAGRRLRPRPDRPARQQGIRASLQRTWQNHTVQGRRRVEPLRQLPRHASTSTAAASRRSPTSIAAPASRPAQIAGGGWTGLQFDVSTTSDFNGLIAHHRRQRRSRRVLHRL